MQNKAKILRQIFNECVHLKNAFGSGNGTSLMTALFQGDKATSQYCWSYQIDANKTLLLQQNILCT